MPPSASEIREAIRSDVRYSLNNDNVRNAFITFLGEANAQPNFFGPLKRFKSLTTEEKVKLYKLVDDSVEFSQFKDYLKSLL